MPNHFDVFLSYCHDDGFYVEELANQIDDHGLKVWLDKWVLIPGGRWQQEMAQGLKSANTCAVCIGQKTPDGWFREEIGLALNLQVKNESFRVIPILLPGAQEINVDDFLELRTWIDFRNGIDDKRAFHVLMSGISGRPPGRIKDSDDDSDETLRECEKKLMQLKKLHNAELIDDDNLYDYRCRILDKFVEKI